MSTNEQGFQPLHGLFVFSPCRVAITSLSIVIDMKTDRHGQAKILTSDEIQRLFETGFTCDRDRALFGICLYTACRINEACTLLATDVYDARGARAKITIRKGNTKGQQDTRQVATHSVLSAYLNVYRGQDKEHLFPGRHGKGHLHPTSADAISAGGVRQDRTGRS